MAYELKPRRLKSSWDAHPMRNMKSAKRFEGKKAPMTVLGDGDRRLKYYPYLEEITKFLRSHIGQPVNEVYSKFLKTLGNKEYGFNPHKIWKRNVKKETDYTAKKCGGWFYEDSGGILREFKRGNMKKSPKLTDKQRKYNTDNFKWPSPDIYNTMGVGPYPLKEKAWVNVKGQIMLLPIYLIDVNARNGKNERIDRGQILQKKKNLEQFIPVSIEHNNGSLTILYTEMSQYFPFTNSGRQIVFSVRIGDIESYKKEKFYEKIEMKSTSRITSSSSCKCSFC